MMKTKSNELRDYLKANGRASREAEIGITTARQVSAGFKSKKV